MWPHPQIEILVNQCARRVSALAMSTVAEPVVILLSHSKLKSGVLQPLCSNTEPPLHTPLHAIRWQKSQYRIGPQEACTELTDLSLERHAVEPMLPPRPLMSQNCYHYHDMADKYYLLTYLLTY